MHPEEKQRKALEIAKERHAARSQDDIDKIQRRWNNKRIEDLYNFSDRIGSYRDNYLRDGFLLLEDDYALDEFESFKKDYDSLKVYIEKKD